MDGEVQQCSTSYTEMKTTLAVAIFLLTEIVWTTTSTVIHAKEELSPRDVTSPDVTCPIYCTCSDSPSYRDLNCTVSKNEDFDGIRDLLSADSYNDYYRVELHMAANLSIPADVLGGKRAKELTLNCPDSSTPPGQIHVDAFQSTLNYTNRVNLNSCNLTDFRFAFLAPFTTLKELAIYDSSLKKINDMPSLPTLTHIYIIGTTDFESWYSPSMTPNLEQIEIKNNPDLDDEKMEKILSSMTNFYTYQKLTDLNLANNALTRVPPLAFSFPSLTRLDLIYNPIVTLKTGSVNNTYDNLRDLVLSQTKLTTVEPRAFIGNFSSTHIHLNLNPMTTFPSSSFQYLLESMVGHDGYVSIIDNPISDDCGLAWLIRDNRELLRHVFSGAIANGTRFEDLNEDEYSNCFEN